MEKTPPNKKILKEKTKAEKKLAKAKAKQLKKQPTQSKDIL
jgi:hypothetical protein